MNGRLTLDRTFLWNPQYVSYMPLDWFLGIEHSAYSLGVRDQPTQRLWNAMEQRQC